MQMGLINETWLLLRPFSTSTIGGHISGISLYYILYCYYVTGCRDPPTVNHNNQRTITFKAYTNSDIANVPWPNGPESVDGSHTNKIKEITTTPVKLGTSFYLEICLVNPSKPADTTYTPFFSKYLIWYLLLINSLWWLTMFCLVIEKFHRRLVVSHVPGCFLNSHVPQIL